MSDGMIRVTFVVDEHPEFDDEDFGYLYEAVMACVPRVGEGLRITSRLGDVCVTGIVSSVNWGQEVTTKDGKAGVWFPCGRMVATVGIKAETVERHDVTK